MNIPHLHRTPLAIAVLSATAMPMAQADTSDRIQDGLDDAKPQFEVVSSSADSEAIQHPDLAQDADGDFVVVWQQDGSTNDDIKLQRFEADGDPTDSSPLTVASGGSGATHLEPAVAMDDAGNAVVTWHKQDPNDNGCNGNIVRRSLSAGSSSFGSEKNVPSGSPGLNSAYCHPEIARDADGDYVVVWEDDSGSEADAVFRMFNASGAAQGAQDRLASTSTAESREDPGVAMNDSGSFIAAWSSTQSSDGFRRLYGRIFSATGTPSGGEFRLDDGAFGDTGPNTSSQANPALAMDDDGDFIAAWIFADANQGKYGIGGQLWKADGSVVNNGDFRDFTDDFQDAYSIDVAVDDDKHFLAGWTFQDASKPSTVSVNFQGYAADGDALLSQPASLTASGTSIQGTPGDMNLASDGDLDLAAAWSEQGSSSIRVQARGVPTPDSQFASPGSGGGGGGTTGPLALLLGGLALGWRRLRRTFG